MSPRLRNLFAVLLVGVLGLSGVPSLTVTPVAAQTATEQPDLEAWDLFATGVERLLAGGDATLQDLNSARARLVDWRARLVDAQGVNKDRIATLQDQIAALGPAPADGAQEPDDIAARRAELNAQLTQLQAPGLAAQEARSRADGLMREIDTKLRTIEKNALQELSPSPVNPVNWPAGLGRIVDVAMTVQSEVAANWALDQNRARMQANLPLIVGYLLFAILAIVVGRRWIENRAARMQQGVRARGRSILAFAVSLGQIVLPMIGALALTQSLMVTAMFGPVGEAFLTALPKAAFALFAARWLGTRLFPRGDAPNNAPFRLVPVCLTEGRLYSSVIGILIGLDILRRAVVMTDVSDAASVVIQFPLLLLLGLLLARTGMLLRQHAQAELADPEEGGVLDRAIGLIGRLAILSGVVGPVLAAIGYVAAAEAIVYPAAISMGLLGVMLLIQQVFTDAVALISGGDEGAANGLLPVMFALILVLASIPLFALIWGVRADYLLEVGARLQEGITIGQSRISPSDVLYFILVFVIILGITRMVQGTLRTSVLPKTRIDKGGSNAIVSGVGYIGIFLAGLIAFTSAGIDLSSLAIVAGALSVGIGFGLQNIVSNFVSGIILLIERPVSEGDWIEVGSQMGVVRAISVRSTRIETFDRTEVIVPNADLVSGTVTNWTRSNMNGRIIVSVGVAYGTDTRKVEEILREIIEDQPLVMMAPPPTVLFFGFGADSLDFEIRAILSDVNFAFNVKSDIHHEIARRFSEEGIEIPFGQRDIWLRNPEALGAALEAVSPAQPKRPVDAPPRRSDPSIGLMDDGNGDGDGY